MCEFALGSAIGVLIHGHPFACEHPVGATAVLVIVIVDQEPRLHAEPVQLPAHIPGLLSHLGSVGAVGHGKPDHAPLVGDRRFGVLVRIQYAAALNRRLSLGVVPYSESVRRSHRYRTRLTVSPRPTKARFESGSRQLHILQPC